MAKTLFEKQRALTLALFEGIINHPIINAELPDKIFAGKCNGMGAKRHQLEALFSLGPQKVTPSQP